MFTEALFLSIALSLDAFVAGFSYGVNKIRIPWTSALVIDGICSFSLGASLLLGSFLKNWIPPQLTTVLCFTILFLLGLSKLLDGLTKTLIKKYGAISSNFHFSLCNFRFVLSLYADPEAADLDHSKTISPKEASSLAIALSLDGCAVGFGAALGNAGGYALFLCSLIVEALALFCGTALGNRAAKKLPFNAAWISGGILLLLAFLKLL
ncbi:MAG: sporulation membrane protein YtaF [Lachnospiraceae bacterium]|nr:sporulation membrane protein YtaF [Lachnospiraceae bacterium]